MFHYFEFGSRLSHLFPSFISAKLVPLQNDMRGTNKPKMPHTLTSGWFFIICAFLPQIAHAANEANHNDPIASVIISITLIFFFAVIGRLIARQFNQPAVLGELLMGVLIGNLGYYANIDLIIILREGSAIFNIVGDMLRGVPLDVAVNSTIPDVHYAQQVTLALGGENGTEILKVAYVADVFSRYGVIFLLFMVGLETSVEELKHTGKESFIVAVIGVIAPIILGYTIARILMPESSFKSDLFIAATLCATSIGITARVLKEMKKLQTREAKTILGAAMIDDILGLVILAIVSSIVISGVVNVFMVSRIIVLALVFFTLALMIGPWVLRKAVKFFSFLELWEAKLFISFIFLMSLAWLATLVQLATIIGAFAAGVILHDGYFPSQKYSKEMWSIKHLVGPLESILAPLFFVLIGIQVKIESFMDWDVILLASGLIIAAIVGKLVSGLGASRKSDRWLIGIGMMPRGEVGLVFASIGRTLGVMSDQLFSAIILMVITTTILAPPLLKARYTYNHRRQHR
ncbi:Na(+)/H(+) antiporter [Legionella israelensis]|uniref:Na(+)/H(+) antiporter n=2 Tax=Legionella israelensis TaxID=454 RepID=A0A0W0VWJ4_9GAMM|nr:cation:proton antiporter [Legionella israelensis]KTD24385.1 Na(+)/H(+) antiporter [Legionella israelensis]SCY41101.1 sodium/proton antiporter NhaS3, CPA2 family (TC 2.A.37.2.4) [Legionella israelensis DSM 19235]STX58398.1 Na(+)/H(+) antiporter [Legionella israelensis]